ncbi:MAG: hypothetical protein ACXAE3_05180 [Candidatus Kariarchaeaceae archaeon]|jgi:hypothetical protein
MAGYTYLLKKLSVFIIPALLILGALLVSADSLGLGAETTAVEHGAGCDKP